MRSWTIGFGLLVCALLTACTGTTPLPLASQPAQTLILYDWAGYMPQSVLDAFTDETGIQVKYLVYGDQAEALENMRAGNQYDVVVLDNTYVPIAIAEGLLAELDYANIPNFRNVSPSFRDLAYDPENKHSITIQWGTTGLVVRTDRVAEPVTGWADLWDPRYAGDVGVWNYPEEVIGIALMSLGYSLSSEDPAELAAAAEKVLALRDNVYLIDPELATGVEYLLDDHTVMIYGWSYDAREAQAQLDTVAYVLPKEGTILWSDNVTIPANSEHKAAAERFINFLFRPDISAQIVNELWVAVPNDAALPSIKTEILVNPIVYPPNASLANAEFYEVVGEATTRFYAQVWESFLAEDD